MQFFFVKSNILHKWLKNLCRYYLNMFAPENSLLWRSIPATRPCQPPDPASHQIQPATRPCQLPHPAHPAHAPSLPPLPTCLSLSATTASQTLWSVCAALVLLRRLYVWGTSECATHFNDPCRLSNIIRYPYNILCTISNILPYPSNILCTVTTTVSNILLIQ